MKFSIEHRDFLETEIHPEQLAVSGSDKDLTWKELQQLTLQYERKFKALGLKAGQAVGIIGHKEADYLAVICACIKLGCPYIPMDKIYPQERISKILYIGGVFCYVNLETKMIETSFMKAHIRSFKAEDELIYIIFTSGSTGEPKGVQITKENVLSLLTWMNEDFNLPENAVFMNQAPFSFDLSVYEVLYTLHFGKTIILNSREMIADSESFYERVKKYQVNTWVSTPSFAWAQVISDKFNSNYLPQMKSFLFCGEVLPVKLVKKLRQLFPEAKILNTYGPTEATVATTLVEVTDQTLEKYDQIPIGYPKKGTRVFVDAGGEICIHGSNVMKGYLNREDLNESKMFFENGLRGFKTGDIGFVKDDLLFCQGRMDDQIKLHGYRIELTEIEHALTKSSGIKEAACLPIRRGGEVVRIAAFVVRDPLVQKELSEFSAEVGKNLPQYMIPSEFILIDSLPMNTNHKVDRKKLNDLFTAGNLIKWV